MSHKSGSRYLIQKQWKHVSAETCMLMFVVALCTITKTCKQPNCPSTGEWINYWWYIHTVGYYLAIKRMNYQCTKQHGWIADALCQVKETTLKKLHNIMIAFTQNSGRGKIIGTGNRPNDCQGLGLRRCWLQRSMSEFLRVVAVFCILIVVVVGVTKLQAFVKTHRTAD